MQIKRFHYVFAAISFLVAFLTYTTTMQPGIPFWDCGEFIGAAVQLGISHPPGTPLWTLIGHVGSWLAPYSDLATKYNFLSALAGSLSVLLLYLTAVKVIRVWRGEPQSMTDAFVHFGGALIAAMSFAWSDSVWFNSSEFIVFSPGLLLIALVLWIAMIYHEKAEETGGERWLILALYLIGLSMGAHQMTMLAFFPLWAIAYYRHKPTVTMGSFLSMMLVGTLFFLYIFFDVLTGFVGWAGGAKQGLAPIFILAANIGIVYYLWNNDRALSKLLITGAIMVFLGYSTYAFVMVRGDQDPPMNQHSPKSFGVLHEYIARLQYGEAREWPRRDDRQKEEPLHAPTWGGKPSCGGEPYSSELDFMWRYQANHMYFRYLLWNFVGREADVQDAGVTWSHTWGIPFLIGLFGMYWHYRRDPKRFLAMLGGFMIMGLLTALYQNQQDAQPRERDYFYVGAFWIYAMWVGIGATGIMELMRARMGAKKTAGAESTDEKTEWMPIIRGEGGMGQIAGVFALALVLIPINQCVGLFGMTVGGETFKQASKWGEYSRYHNNFPFEYAYNILQSCDQDAILFTAGDNDTFPLWCIQDLYGVRTDVRIVNLSLGNMGWYIKKLKDGEPWGGKKVNLPGFTDKMLDAPDDSPEGVHYFPAAPSMVTVNVSADAMARFTGQHEAGSFSWKYTSQMPYQNGQYIYTVADQLIREIVVNNINDRPIYFAVAVPPSYWTGLDQHVVFEGFTARIVPTTHTPVRGNGIDGDINEPLYVQTAYNISKGIETKPFRGTLMHTFADPQASLSGLDERYGTTTYFEVYGRLANYYITHGNQAAAHRALDTLSARLPISGMQWHYDYNLLQAIGQLYEAAGDKAASVKYIQAAAKALSAGPAEEGGDENTIVRNQFNRANIYYGAEMYDSARAIFTSLRQQLQGPDQQFMDFRIAQIDVKTLIKKGDKQGALKKVNETLMKFQQLNQGGAADQFMELNRDRINLMNELGVKDTGSLSSAAPTIVAVPPPPAQQQAPATPPPAGK